MAPGNAIYVAIHNHHFLAGELKEPTDSTT